MKLLTLNIIIFAIQYVNASSKSPEVIELVQENVMPDAYVNNLMKYPNTMLHYLSRYRRQSLDPKSTMDTYIAAYKLNHESYQNQQESDTAKIAEENAQILKRSKRAAAASPAPPNEKDFIRFELTDAIQPDEKTVKHRVINKGKNFRMPFEIADTLVVFGNKTEGVDIEKPNEKLTNNNTEAQSEPSPNQNRRRRRKSRKENSKPKREIYDYDSEEEDEADYDDDEEMSIGQSRKIKIIAPAGKTRNGEIPIGVKKIIEMVLQDRARAAKARHYNGPKPYGDKINNNQGKEPQYRQKNVVRDINGNNNNNNNEWKPIPQISLGRYPVIHNQMENAPDYLTFVPVKSYKTVAYGKPLSETQQQEVKPTILPVTNIVPVPQIQYIIKEVPVPVTSAIKPSFKVTYDTSLLDHAKEKEPSLSSYYSGFDKPTQAPKVETSESYVKIVTPTTATKTVIDHSKAPEYKNPTPAPSYEPSPSYSPSNYQNSPFKPSKQVYVAPILQNNYDDKSKTTYEHQFDTKFDLKQYENKFDSQFNEKFESQKLDALTSLLNKNPSDQLKGFHDLLQEEKKSQENTAPILFHPNGIIPPKPVIKLNLKVLQDPPKSIPHQEPISIEEFNRLYGGKNGVEILKDDPPTEIPVKEDASAGFEGYKTSFKSITEPAKSYENSKAHYSPLRYTSTSAKDNQPAAPVIKHHDHSQGSSGITKGYEDDSDLNQEHSYAFGYRVRDYYTGNDFGHTQNKNTDGKITGEYHILLPDKRVQIVRYYANDDGFHADVSYETPQTH